VENALSQIRLTQKPNSAARACLFVDVTDAGMNETPAMQAPRHHRSAKRSWCVPQSIGRQDEGVGIRCFREPK